MLDNDYFPQTLKRTICVHAFLADIGNGVKNAFAYRLNPESPGYLSTRLSFAITFFVLCICGWAKLEAGADSLFWIWGFSIFATRFCIWMAGLFLLTFVLCRSDTRPIIAILVLTLYSTLTVALFAEAISALFSCLGLYTSNISKLTVFTLLQIWIALVYVRAISHYRAGNTTERLSATVVYGALLVGLIQAFPPAAIFLNSDTNANSEFIDIEAIYYRQQQLVTEQLRTLSPQHPGTIDIYFVGLAPFGTEDVFIKEVTQAKSAVEKVLLERGRSLLLINHRDTLNSVPLANLPNLRSTLNALGRLFDSSDDIVFLFLTSHGSETGVLSAELGNLYPNDVDAMSLRQALDHSKIKWRIIVISACYSGSFIDALKSPTTMIITAASADRASFGCEHGNDWTYFGEAFFSNGLSNNPRIDEAFVEAMRSVREREEAEGKMPSNPQIFVGQEIEIHLNRFYRER